MPRSERASVWSAATAISGDGTSSNGCDFRQPVQPL